MLPFSHMNPTPLHCAQAPAQIGPKWPVMGAIMRRPIYSGEMTSSFRVNKFLGRNARLVGVALRKRRELICMEILAEYYLHALKTKKEKP